MTAACTLVGNRDIENMVPLVISSIANPAEVQDTVHKLASTTFVQQVESPALSIMVPLLLRGLRERVTAIKRKAALIADNMSKLVDNPAEAMVFLPRLMPEIEKVGMLVDDRQLPIFSVYLAPGSTFAPHPFRPRVLPFLRAHACTLSGGYSSLGRSTMNRSSFVGPPEPRIDQRSEL